MYDNVALDLAAFAPFLAAIFNRRPGGFGWKFLAFCACAQTIVLLAVVPPLAIIVWLIGWLCVVAGRLSANRQAVEHAVGL
jgi:hypothetical protein